MRAVFDDKDKASLKSMKRCVERQKLRELCQRDPRSRQESVPWAAASCNGGWKHALPIVGIPVVEGEDSI
ncbi:hypothetical protein JX265_000036 [Neoarthrinium moseri]|uniref:Uncharacterized protein n=1 Tax=Neoarthrinium moseri TaxID=1658444 RepID=A0A9P9WXP9_9PEZI|nr:hypothetical protein JX266_008150 [Neoarthrinium moseri]KAI1881210.1 hypothetical protein JX265_000036 [Neoarthrinium moseri]